MWAFIAKFFSMLTYGASAGEKVMMAADKYAGGAVVHATKFERTMEIESGIEIDALLAEVEAKRVARKQIASKPESESFDV